MPILNKVAKLATRPLPRMITPAVHAVMDYGIAASFLVASLLFWRRNKRASMAALLCGAAEVATSLLTDYPGGVEDVISFLEHRDLDLGLAAMAATMPEFMGFEDDPEKKFFLAQGALITGASELTQFSKRLQLVEKRRVKRVRAA